MLRLLAESPFLNHAFHLATLQLIEDLSPSVKRFVLHCPDPVFHRLPGQWVQVVRELAGQIQSASFSVTSSTREMGHIELAIKVSARHPLTRWLHEAARVGDTLELSNGQGDFFYRAEMGRRVVLIGAGTGITPLISIFRYIAEEVPHTDASLVYSITTVDEYLFRDDIERLSQQPNLHSIVTLTQADAAWSGNTGRIGQTLLERAGLDQNTLYYLCGPQAMVDELSELLVRLGVPTRHTIYEKWW